MQKFSIPFGKGHIHFELPDEQVAGVLLSQPPSERTGQGEKDVHYYFQ